MTVGSFPFCLCHRTMVKAVVSKIAFFRKPVCLHIFHMFMNLICSKLWGMTLGAKTPGPVKSIDFRGLSGPNGWWASPLERKKCKPPWTNSWIRPCWVVQVLIIYSILGVYTVVMSIYSAYNIYIRIIYTLINTVIPTEIHGVWRGYNLSMHVSYIETEMLERSNLNFYLQTKLPQTRVF